MLDLIDLHSVSDDNDIFPTVSRQISFVATRYEMVNFVCLIRHWRYTNEIRDLGLEISFSFVQLRSSWYYLDDIV